MANSVDEQLSALMDGELAERELLPVLERLRCDGELARRWQRYHVIRDALHGSLPADPKLDLSARVRDSLRDEPTLLVPRRKMRHYRGLLRQAAGMAIAASVAAIAVFAFQSFNAGSPARMASTVSEPAAMERVAQQTQVMVRDPRLDAYLVNHNEHSVSTGMHGMLPYVRIVSDGTEGEAAQ